MTEEQKAFDVDNLPDDVEVYSKEQEFTPIDPSQMYHVEIEKVEIRLNPFYRPDAKKKADQGSKYQVNFEYTILDEGEFRERKIWDATSLAFKPTGKKGPSKLYKIVMAALGVAWNWDEVAEFAPDPRTFYQNLRDYVIGTQIKVAVENTVSKTSGKPRTKVMVYYMTDKALPPVNELLKPKELKKGKKKKDSQDITDTFK